ncbi:PAS sensor protein [Paenibacillus riograndensis]|uniref:PAS sensor protein n=2 Tax=Paenibacillus riograndensis TaxID=483937 RepID=A0A132U9T4_9BACL|nr:AAA family ATPase [Paenibacillus riograndensis]KWX80288.1 PAS sensor protein [Paenibacillus riograndensis]
MKVNQQIHSVIRSSLSETADSGFNLQHDADITLREFMEGQPCVKPEVFLPLARSITAGVLQLHQLQTLHLDLRPERIGVRSIGQEAYLIDSGYALHRSDNGYVPTAGYSMSDTVLPYCSPENTGRMLRTVDERSDLYSIGVIFYELLAGHLPFLAEDPLEWVYMHLAQAPPPLTQKQSHLPDGLEAVVMRLLDKNPDNRYQNAGFLLADLDKIGRSQETIFMEPGFHGREYEISMLTQAFYSACFGSTEMVYVSGEAGIGKTSLIDEVFRKQQHTRNFFYVAGKFEQISKDSPYHPIIQAFRGLMRHLLGEREEQSKLWRQKLQGTLGASANVISAIIPEVELILGSMPPAEELPANESKKRFIYVFRKFVQALASKEHPLVLFIDDLQWADSSSMQLIHALLCDPECQYLMFICAYRPNETDCSKLPGYELDGSVTDQAVIRHIHLSPLSLEQMNHIVMETLNSGKDTALSFTELLYPKSGGNPFHFKQILLHLQDDGILQYNHGSQCWQWNLGQIIGQEPSYAINDLMEHRLRRLSSAAQELLQIAACAGSTFHPDLIACVANQKTGEVHAEWAVIEAEGMILPYDTDKFRFAHDNIQKLIYSQMEDETKQAIHIRIGTTLQAAGDEEDLFDVVNHLNKGSGKNMDEAENLRLVQLNLDAGNRAKAASAYDVALVYFRKGVELLSEEAWNKTFGLCFELHAEQAECEYLCGNLKESDRQIDSLLRSARNPAERSRVQMIRIMQYINQGKYLEGTALGLESLREHHIIIPPDPGKFVMMIEAMRIEVLLRNRYDKLADLEEMSDHNRIAAMNLILAIIPSTFFTNKKIYFLLMCRAIQLSIKYGNTPVSAAVYSAYGMLLGSAWGKFDKGYALGKVGMELSERYNITSVKSKTYTMFGGVLCQFAGNALEGEGYLTKALRFGLESGDYVFASYAIGAHVNSLYTRAPLSEFARTIAEYMAVLDTTNDGFVKQNFYLYQQFILALQGRTAAPDSFSSAGFEEEEFLCRIQTEETSATTLFQYNTYKTQLCYLLGNYEDAIQWARRAESYKDYATHLPHLPECLFYESLAILAGSAQPWKEAGAHTRKRLLSHLDRFQKWAAWSPDNYRPRYELLQAEFARASGEFMRAEELYDKAIREAREQDDIQVTSLSGELAASHYWSRGNKKTALFYLQLALEAYTGWGVQVKLAQLENLMRRWQRDENADTASESLQSTAEPDKARQAAETSVSRNMPNAFENFDLAAILKTTQAISNQMDIDTLLAEIMNTIMKYAGASKGALLMGSNDGLYIQAYADSEAQVAPTPLELNDSSFLPEGIIRYVFRTQEDVHYSGDEDSWLIHNPYIAKHRPGSALCIPVTVHSNMLGILYLENRLASGVFAYERMAVLQAMASNGILMCMLQNSAEPSLPEPGLIEEPPLLSPIMEEPLTDRELEVLALLAAGLSNKEIADQLIIAIGTVKVHVKNIFAKLKVNRRTKAIVQAKELKLLDPSKDHYVRMR